MNALRVSCLYAVAGYRLCTSVCGTIVCAVCVCLYAARVFVRVSMLCAAVYAFTPVCTFLRVSFCVRCVCCECWLRHSMLLCVSTRVYVSVCCCVYYAARVWHVSLCWCASM
eukprot:GILJ01012992.1.p2 GENE.GILJ01012992.1~~GILJ01012992.1.p2  ORF type:complete len:112 (-),score=0.12 GILJ01012992.1:509-844(-)